MLLDVSKSPFSRLGSYFSLSLRPPSSSNPPDDESADELYLHTHHSGIVKVFRIEPIRDGRVVDFKVQATPSEVVLQPAGGGRVEIIISPRNTVRIRGEGVSLKLEMPKERWTTAYQLPGDAWAFNMSNHGVQMALDLIEGSLTVDAPWDRFKGFCMESIRMIAVLDPEPGEVFEAAIDEFVTTWTLPCRPPFDACRDEVAAEWEDWAAGLPDAPAKYEAARNLAGYVNWSAVVEPNGYLRRRTMLMSKMDMCNVYHWDNAFNAMAHCRHDPELAWDQFMVMADQQDEHGKCPNSMNDRDIRYTFSNLPIQGWALQRMWRENPALRTPDRMREAYDYLAGWSRWLCRRTWPGDALPYCAHGFDNWDNATIFDEGVPVIAPDVAAYLIIQIETLVEIARDLGNAEEAASWQRTRDELLDELLAKCWKDDHFVGLRRPSGDVVECESLVVCMPIVLGRRLPEEVRTALVARIREHLTPWGLATEKPTSNKYVERGYWRGPIWAPSTMLVVSGLEDIGELELAETIVRSFCDMCVAHGFYENFDAKTGAGHFDPAYTWTSSVFMIFAEKYR